jgi:hypothetical protein
MDLLVLLPVGGMVGYAIHGAYLVVLGVQLNRIVRKDPRVDQISHKLWAKGDYSVVPGWLLLEKEMTNWINLNPQAAKCRRRILWVLGSAHGFVLLIVIIIFLCILAGVGQQASASGKATGDNGVRRDSQVDSHSHPQIRRDGPPRLSSHNSISDSRHKLCRPLNPHGQKYLPSGVACFAAWRAAFPVACGKASRNDAKPQRVQALLVPQSCHLAVTSGYGM